MTYYMIYTSGESPCTNRGQIKTLKAARAEVKSLIKEDWDEFGLEPGLMKYEIWKIEEADGVIYEEQVG